MVISARAKTVAVPINFSGKNCEKAALLDKNLGCHRIMRYRYCTVGQAGSIFLYDVKNQDYVLRRQ
jgi:hypothetical protein